MTFSEWSERKLSEIIEFNPRESIAKGKLAKKVSMEKLRPFEKTIDGYELAEFKGGAKFRNGDTLLARITPCLENGKTAHVTILEGDEVGFGSTEFIVLRAKPGKADNDFVYYLAITPKFRKIAIQSMVGTSGRQRVQQDVLENTVLLVPEIAEQKAIAAILTSLDDKIELNNRINKTLEEIAQAIFKSWFVDFEPFQDGEFVDSELGKIPKGWRVGILDELASITMGQSPRGTSYNTNGDGVVFYQGRTDFRHRFPKVRLFTTEPKRMAKKGDILLSVRAPVGDINVASEACCIGRGLASLRSRNGNNSFLLYLLFSLKPTFNVFDGEGTVFGSINKDTLKTIKIVVPPGSIIKQFQSIVEPIDKLIESNSLQNDMMASIRDALLPKLMSGEIRVPFEEV